MAASARSPAPLLKLFWQRRTGCLQRRCKAEKNSREQRDASRKDQHVSVKCDLLGTRQSRRQYSQRRLCSPRGQEPTQPPAHQSEQDTLGEQLAHYTPLACSERRPD